MKVSMDESIAIEKILFQELPDVSIEHIANIVLKIREMFDRSDDSARKTFHSGECINVKLETSAQVMRAFLSGHKLINSSYYDKDGDFYLYLSDSGQICEEDGAGAKAFRVPICMRNFDDWWAILGENK